MTAPGGEAWVTIFHATHLDGSYVASDGRSFARYVARLNDSRSRLAKPGDSLFLGNGDDISPELLRRVQRGYRVSEEPIADTGGRHAIDALNAAALDVETYGFNELDWLQRLVALIPDARFAFVSANVRDDRTGDVYGAAKGARRWVIKEVAGVRFGITGLISYEAAQYAGPGVRILEPDRALREVVPAMRADGADVVIVLSHLDTRTEAQRVASAVEGIDLILGSHIGEPTRQPQRIDGALLSVPEFGLAGFGQLDLTFRAGRISGYEFRQHTVAPDGPEDPAVAAILDRYGAPR